MEFVFLPLVVAIMIFAAVQMVKMRKRHKEMQKRIRHHWDGRAW